MSAWTPSTSAFPPVVAAAPPPPRADKLPVVTLEPAAGSRVLPRLVMLVTGQDETGRLLVRPLECEPRDDLLRQAPVLRLSDEVLPVAKQPVLLNNRYSPSLPSEDPAGALVEGLAPGTVLVAQGCLGWPDDVVDAGGTIRERRLQLRLAGAGVLEQPATPDNVLSVLSVRTDETVPGVINLDYHTAVDWLHWEADAERARHEPNEALAFVWLDDKGRRDGAILAHRGAYLFHQEEENGQDLRYSGLTMPDGPGLWEFTNGQYWQSHCPESGHVDDHGLNGSWRRLPPAEAAARWDLTDSAMLAAMAEAYEFDLPAGLTLLEAAFLVPGDTTQKQQEIPAP